MAHESSNNPKVKLSHPKCYGCGHNFFTLPAVPEVDDKPIDGGLCHWCLEETQEWRSE